MGISIYMIVLNEYEYEFVILYPFKNGYGYEYQKFVSVSAEYIPMGMNIPILIPIGASSHFVKCSILIGYACMYQYRILRRCTIEKSYVCV